MIVTAHYFVILDNTVVNEPLAPGLPYWIYGPAALPGQETAGRFVEEVLFQSEMWANAGEDAAWVSLRLLECRRMCSRCGHVVVTPAGGDGANFHVVWYVAHNPHADVIGDEAYFNTGRWYDAYLKHECPENFFAGV